MIRENGFLDISNEKEILLTEFKDCSYIFFDLNDGEYLFKVDEKTALYKELFGEEVARSLNIRTVSYDLASLDGVKGVISSNYNPDHLKCYSLYVILNNYYENVICNNTSDYPKEMFLESTQNLETIWWALDYFYKDYADREKIVATLMQELVDSFILQVCLGNSDLHYYNLEILEGEEIHFADNFDYGKCCEINFNDLKENYVLQVFPLDFSNKNTAVSAVRSFLVNADSDLQNYFLEKVQLMPSCEEVFKKVEKKIETTIPEEVKKSIQDNYETYQNSLLTIFQSININKR